MITKPGGIEFVCNKPRQRYRSLEVECNTDERSFMTLVAGAMGRTVISMFGPCDQTYGSIAINKDQAKAVIEYLTDHIENG